MPRVRKSPPSNSPTWWANSRRTWRLRWPASLTPRCSSTAWRSPRKPRRWPSKKCGRRKSTSIRGKPIRSKSPRAISARTPRRRPSACRFALVSMNHPSRWKRRSPCRRGAPRNIVSTGPLVRVSCWETQDAIPLLRELLARSEGACKSQATEDEPAPRVFARQHGSTIVAAAIALCRLGEPEAVPRLLEVHRRVRLFQRVFENAA